MLEFSKERAEAARPQLVANWRRVSTGALAVIWTLKR